MLLYTAHELDFLIDKEAADLKKSVLYTDMRIDSITRAYDYLFKRIKSKNAIWCWGSIGNCFNDNGVIEPTRVWILDVPLKYITVVDSDIWDCVLNEWYYVPEKVYDELAEIFGDNEALDKIESLYNSPYDTYSKLIKPLKNAKEEFDQFLIPTPIHKSWIKKTIIIKPENGKKRNQGK